LTRTRPSHRARGAVLLAAALTLVWGGSTSATTAESSSPPAAPDAADCPDSNEVNIVTNGDARNINPILAVDLDGGWRTDLMFDPLVLVDPQSLEPIPWLADSWTISDDNRTYTFTLRDDATFTDGEPVTSADVEFTVMSMLSPGYQGPFQTDWARLEGAEDVIAGTADTLPGIEVPDEHTIVFTLTDPYAGFLTVMARQLKALPKHLLENEGDLTESSDFSLHPVGSGQYVFESWDKGNSFVAVANPDHWGGEPCLKRITQTVIPDMNTLVASMEAGEYDATIVPPPSSLDTLGQMESLQIYELPPKTPEGLHFNLTQAPFDDPLVRRAIASAIDYQTFGREFMGYEEPIPSAFFSPASWAYDDQYGPPAYDPDAAAALLEQAGFPGGDGLTVQMRTNAGNQFREQELTFVQQQLAAVGIESEIVAEEWGQFITAVGDGNFEVAAVNAGDNAGIPDPTAIEEVYRTGGAANYTGYSNPEVDDLLDQASALVDIEQRKPLYSEVQRILSEDLPFVPGFWYPNLFAVRNDIQGVDPSVIGAYWNIADWIVPS
jgi:peptide/nickel transport system substrate-binding protein